MYLGLLREIVSILVRIILRPNMRLIIVHSSVFIPYDQYLIIFLQAMASQAQHRMLNTNAEYE